MEVGAANNDYSYPPNQQRDPVKTLDKDAFLQLFVAQLQYQDPTGPQDTGEFIAQMAQFSILEQLTNLNKEMAQLRLAQEISEASGLIGRQVKILADDQEVSGQVEKVTINDDAVRIYVNGTGYNLDQVTEVQ